MTSAIYTEVLQFFMIVLGFAPVVYTGMSDLGGWDKLKTALHVVAANPTALNLAQAPDRVSAIRPMLGQALAARAGC